MKFNLVNPQLVSQKTDIFSSGIPYFPIELAYVASVLKKAGHEVNVIDAFGENPFKFGDFGKGFFFQGITNLEVAAKLDASADATIIYASLVSAHSIVLALCKAAKEKTRKPVVVFENTQQVYAYSLQKTLKEILENGADYVITGEPEERVLQLASAMQGKKSISEVDGLAYLNKGTIAQNPKKRSEFSLDELPYPAFDEFPFKNYWKLGYSHGPFSGPYLPMLTSRGCPFNCAFCVVPSLNESRWRARSPESVVAEMEHWKKTLGVSDFHWEDLNSTVDKKRIKSICKLIIKRGLKATWKICSGTKVETLDEEELEEMKNAGCAYISVSPESGSAELMKRMNKPLDHEHCLKMISAMNKLGIKSQACFVIGFPTETAEDRKKTREYLKKLVLAGLDETAIFIITPIPGSKVYETMKPPDGKMENLTFSPAWRSDYKELQGFRKTLYLDFFKLKFSSQPSKTVKMLSNILRQKFDLKGEMALWRVIKTAKKRFWN